MTTKTPEQPTPIELTPDQIQRIVSLKDDYNNTSNQANFTDSTLLTWRLNSAIPVQELATEVLYRSETINYEEKRDVLKALGGIATKFKKLPPAKREEYTYAIPGISVFSQHIDAMRHRVVGYSKENEPRVTETRQFLSFVILDHLVEGDKSLSKAG